MHKHMHRLIDWHHSRPSPTNEPGTHMVNFVKNDHESAREVEAAAKKHWPNHDTSIEEVPEGRLGHWRVTTREKEAS